MVTQNMLRIYAGKKVFLEKQIRVVTTLDLMPLTDTITEITSNMCTYIRSLPSNIGTMVLNPVLYVIILYNIGNFPWDLSIWRYRNSI